MAIMSVRSYLKINKGVFKYEGANGEMYDIKQYQLENNTLYRIYVSMVSDNVAKNYDYSLYYSPYDVEDLDLEEGIAEKVISKGYIYITQDPDLPSKTDGRSNLAVRHIAQIVGTADGPFYYGLYKINTEVAFTKHVKLNVSKSVPIKTCDDANDEVAVIEVRLGNETKIYSEGECIIVEGTNEKEILMAADKLAYSLLGVF